MIAIKVPTLGESIVEATVSRWLKKEGDAIAIGDTLVELETDKITVEVPALAAGVLTKRERNEGDVVKVDELLGELTEGATATSAPAPQAAAPAAAPDPAAGNSYWVCRVSGSNGKDYNSEIFRGSDAGYTTFPGAFGQFVQSNTT